MQQRAHNQQFSARADHVARTILHHHHHARSKSTPKCLRPTTDLCPKSGEYLPRSEPSFQRRIYVQPPGSMYHVTHVPEITNAALLCSLEFRMCLTKPSIIFFSNRKNVGEFTCGHVVGPVPKTHFSRTHTFTVHMAPWPRLDAIPNSNSSG